MNIKELSEKQKDIILEVLAFKESKRLEKVVNNLSSYERLSSFNKPADEDGDSDFNDHETCLDRDMLKFVPVKEEEVAEERDFTTLTYEECKVFIGKMFERYPSRSRTVLKNLDRTMEIRMRIREKQERFTRLIAEHEVAKFKESFAKTISETFDSLIDELLINKKQ
jgi:hypothetical protein